MLFRRKQCFIEPLKNLKYENGGGNFYAKFHVDLETSFLNGK